MQDFSGKVAVITGAASGVGKHLALRFAREGVKIVLSDIEAGPLEEAAAEVRSLGVEAIGVQADVANRAQIEALRDRAYDEFGKVNILINNAGVGGAGAGHLWNATEQSYRWVMDVNFFGPLHGIHAFVPRMIEQGDEGLVASTSSAAGLVFPPTSPGYSASKAALVALMEVLAMQLKMAGSKLKAAILFPGPHVVDTKLFDSGRNRQGQYLTGTEKAPGVTTTEQFKTMMKDMLGREVDITKPEDYAEDAYQGILRDEFYLLPLNENTKQAIRDRTERMLARGRAEIPNMF